MKTPIDNLLFNLKTSSELPSFQAPAPYIERCHEWYIFPPVVTELTVTNRSIIPTLPKRNLSASITLHVLVVFYNAHGIKHKRSIRIMQFHHLCRCPYTVTEVLYVSICAINLQPGNADEC